MLGAVLGAEASGISLFGLVLGAVLGSFTTVIGRREKLSAGPECQYIRFKEFALSEHTSAFALAFVFGFLAFAFDSFQVIVARVITHDWG